jgi:2,4-dienoyl-CoA reductase-like NADH-dependent reductase (Old Yellow Enzyme family)
LDTKETLLSPIKIGNRTSPNRFFMQSMECSDADADGNPTEATIKRYEDIFRGQGGVVDLEAITVSSESRARLNQLEILPRNEKPLKNFVSRLKEVNPATILLFQLTHAGELASTDYSRRVTVKPLYGIGGDQLSEEDVEKIIDQFVLSAKIAHDIGADGIDMKLCHGYLGSQILRPYNDGNWKYGGSWEKRSRFAYDLYERINREINDKNFLIGSKLSAWEGFPGGCGSAGPDSPLMDLTESLALVKGLEERGAQYFIQSAGCTAITEGLTNAGKSHSYFAYLHIFFANEYKKVVKPQTVIIGSGFTVFRNGKNNGMQAIAPEDGNMLTLGAKCVNDGSMDMVGLGRQTFADPHVPRKLAEGRENEIKYCTICDHCLELLFEEQPIGCCTYDRHYAQVYAEMRKRQGRET